MKSQRRQKETTDSPIIVNNEVLCFCLTYSIIGQSAPLLIHQTSLIGSDPKETSYHKAISRPENIPITAASAQRQHACSCAAQLCLEYSYKF